jgi:hypothetical protein
MYASGWLLSGGHGEVNWQGNERRRNMKRVLSLAILISSLCGCRALDPAIIWIDDIFKKIPQSEQPSTPTTTSTTTTTTIPPVISEDKNEDTIDYSKIVWHGQNKADKATITKVLRSVTIYGDNRVMLDYDTNSDWPGCRVIEGCRSSFMVFTEMDGVIQGGHVDHMRLNAKQRDLGNLYNGYLMGAVPHNQVLYCCIASHDGKERSNIVMCIRK